jgi:NAD(P)-dependent dehydrogenase (short-subunit alcohol dehydrogenase family)
MKIEGAVALVTGANRGIGASIVDALLAGGASRIYAAMRTPSSAAREEKVVPIALDITDAVQVANAATLCADVQILINNAGILLGQPLLAASQADAAEREMRVNYFGTLAVCRAFAPILGRNGGGAIVNMLSILAR